jgi:hypothetical protein
MLPNALLAATLIMVALLFALLSACDYLQPYRWLLLRAYGASILVFAVVLFLNLTALFYLVGRALFLRDTGRKLAHVEKQLRSRSTIVKELSERLEE